MLIVIGDHYRDGPKGPDPIVNRDDLLGMVIHIAKTSRRNQPTCKSTVQCKKLQNQMTNTTIAIACDVSSKLSRQCEVITVVHEPNGIEEAPSTMTLRVPHHRIEHNGAQRRVFPDWAT